MRVLLALLMTVGLADAGQARAANLVKDGGFEMPAVPVGSLTRFSTGQTIGPWTVVGADGNVDLISKTFTYEGFAFPAKAGAQWLDLTGDSQTATGVAQTFATTVGASYTLKFSVGSVYDPNGNLGTTSTVYVSNGATQILKAVAKGKPGAATQRWQGFTVTFKATSARTTLSFINGDPASDTDCGIDAVSVSPAAPDDLATGLRTR